MNSINNSQKVILNLVGSIWFLVSIDSFFVWGGLGTYLRIIGTIGMMLFSFIIINKWRISANNMISIFFLTVFLLWLLQYLSGMVILGRIFDFVPLLLLLLWPKEILNDWYKWLRKIIIFFAIGSSIVTILSFIGVLEYIPHFTLSGRSQLHRSLGLEYNVYGVFVTVNSSAWAARACGPLQEPGHFAVILGFFHLIDRFSHRKINFWIVLCGLLTFSLNFVLIFVFVEFHNFFIRQKIGKAIKSSIVLVGSIGLLFFILPQQTKDTIVYLFFERNIENVYEDYEATGSLTGALDARTGDYSLILYENIDNNSFLFGTGYYDSSSALSDYRGTILYIGLIGLLLSIIASISILQIKGYWRLKVSLFLSLFLIYLHRGWMMYYAYLYFLSYLAIAVEAAETSILSSKKTENIIS
ncbi:MAG: hypothetical protein VZQ98_16840 [Bacteroidales bacterium]|nr:hypothetical protein [Bacteroidales bacterium]